MSKKRGIFITFEGIDGCGKSTQARKLHEYLNTEGFPTVFTREPGGTMVSEKIRQILLDKEKRIAPLTELFLYEAARSRLAETVILPALEKGQIVICDRYYDSTTAYQGYGRGIDLQLVARLNEEASGNRSPDLTFIFDVDYRTSLARRKPRPDRLENETRAFFDRVRRGFKAVAAQKRTVFLDGRFEIEAIFESVKKKARSLILRRKKNLA